MQRESDGQAAGLPDTYYPPLILDLLNNLHNVLVVEDMLDTDTLWLMLDRWAPNETTVYGRV